MNKPASTVSRSAAPVSLVSIVVTCYNQARYLSETIESVLNQTYPHVEVIVVDDGSQDETAKVVGRYRDVHYIQQQNQGVAHARNNGLRASSGIYIVFLDGDDRLLPEAVAIGVQNLNAHPGCAFVFGQCRLIDSNGTPLPTKTVARIEHDHYARLLLTNYISMPARVMYRREILEEVGGFDPAVDHAGDYNLYLNIMRSHPVYDHWETVAEWRQHETNTSHNIILMLRMTLKVLRAQRRFINGNKKYKEAYKSGIKQWQEYYGYQIVEQVREGLRTPGHRRQTATYTLWLLRLCPQIVGEQIYRKLRHTLR